MSSVSAESQQLIMYIICIHVQCEKSQMQVLPNRTTVKNNIGQFKETGNIINQNRAGRPIILSQDKNIKIDNLMESDNELTQAERTVAE